MRNRSPHTVAGTLPNHDAIVVAAPSPSADSGALQPPIRVIEPPSSWPSVNLPELWRYRDLLFMLVWRDVSINYRQSLVGYGWALFKPLLTLGVFSLIFGKVAQLPSDGIPYPLFCLCGLVPWAYFSTCLSGSVNSVVNSSNLLTKVYFPRLLLPLTSVLSGLMDLAVQLGVLGIVMLCFGAIPGWKIVLLPFLVFLCMITSLAVGLWLTSVNVRYRDVGHLVPFLSQLWMWLTPIVYPSSMVPERWRWVYGLNPMTGVVEAFRWALLGASSPNWVTLGLSFTVVMILLTSGLFYFRRTEAYFADII